MSLQRWARSLVSGSDAAFARPALLFVMALTAIGALSVWAFGFDRAQPAGADGAAMDLQVYADKAKSELVCDVGVVGRKCEIDAGAGFSVDVLTTSPPPGGYEAYRASFQYETGLTLQQQPNFEEHLLGDCIEGSETKAEGVYRLSCKLDNRTTFSGAIANVQFVCGPAGTSAQIDLVGGTKAGGSVYIDPNVAGSLIFLKSEAKGEKLVADAVQINCVDPTPTPTPSPTATRTATQTLTPTVTATATNTPPDSDKTKMSLQVFTDTSETQPACTSNELFRKCNVFADVPFSINVIASSPPDSGYTAFKAVVQYPDKVTLQDQEGLSENRAPACLTGSESVDEPKGKAGEDYTLSCKISTTPSHYAGVLVNVQFICPAGGSFQIDLVGGSSAGVSSYVNPDINGSLIFLKSVPKGTKEVADSVTVNCLGDFDGDGCTNVQELGSEPLLGGLRDPAMFWDFFDVWTIDSGSYTRDGGISADDIVAVASRFLSTGAKTSVDDAMTEPTSSTAYHASYDRGAKTGPDPWDRGPADGAITADDITAVAVQFLHSC